MTSRAQSVGSLVEFEAGRSLYRALRNQGIHLTAADTAIDVGSTGEIESAILDVAYATPVLQVTGVARCAAGPREWSRLTYLGDMFSHNFRRVICADPESTDDA